MRLSILFAGLLTLGALVLLGRPPIAAAAPAVLVPASDAIASAAADSPGSPGPVRRAAAMERSVQILDRLTGEELALEVQLVAPGAEPVALSAASCENLSLFAPDAMVHYRLADDAPASMRLAECLSDDQERWRLTLPYYCRVSIELPEQEQLQGPGELFLCRPPDANALEDGAAEQRGPFDAPGVEMTREGVLTWSLRCGRARTLLESAPAREHLVSAAGRAVLALHLEDGRSGYAECELQPGCEIIARPTLAARPRIAGILLDARGQPLSGATVRLAVALDLSDYDFWPSDPHGMLALRSQGVLHHSLTMRIKTDADGRFATIAPRGRKYAVYTHAQGGYAMWTDASGGREDIVLRLMDPGDESAITFTVLRQSGTPLAGACVQVVPVSDLPFFRQWPTDLAASEQGCLRVLGLEVGNRVCLLIRHADLKEEAFPVPYLTIPATRALTVVVPDEALDKKLAAVRG